MIAVIQASLGGIDRVKSHTPQSIPFDHLLFTDQNLPPRSMAMTPRLQAKIPKFFGWQLAPGYTHYLWLDGNIQLIHSDALDFFLTELGEAEILVLKHPTRPNIRQEVRYTRKGVNQQSIYMLNRYTNEGYQELYDLIEQDKDYTDDLLAIGGVFLYRDTAAVRDMMKEWWYYNTRYVLQDQLSFAYVLKKSKVDYKAIGHDFNTSPFIKLASHIKR